jgi:predicted permease
MSSILFSILAIYIFIVLGFVAKMSFKERIDEKTITIISVYFLQVFLTFWGLLIRPVDVTLLFAPSIYLFIIILVLFISAFVAKRLFKDKKEYSIAIIAAVIGNTGNLGIPLNIAIFGEESIPYTTVINLMNVIIVYTVGVYYYSRGTFNIKSSLINILKLPFLWAAAFALALSAYGYRPSEEVMSALMMGAYASIVMQLFLFGMYLYGTKISEISKKLTLWVISVKFIALPALTFLILYFIKLDSMIKGIIFIELLVPLAIANVNFASLYDCKPKIVTALVFISSIIFLGAIYVGIRLLEYL